MATRGAIRRQLNTTGNRWPQKTHWAEPSGLVTPQWGQCMSYDNTKVTRKHDRHLWVAAVLWLTDGPNYRRGPSRFACVSPGVGPCHTPRVRRDPDPGAAHRVRPSHTRGSCWILTTQMTDARYCTVSYNTNFCTPHSRISRAAMLPLGRLHLRSWASSGASVTEFQGLDLPGTQRVHNG
jgi:hypothetical protein